MPDIQNAKRPGTGQTWGEAYKDVEKTAKSLRDLNEDFASFVADYSEFSDIRKERFEEYLNGLEDATQHWEEINNWIRDNSDSAGVYTGKLDDIRQIFHDISALTGGIRRETADRLNIARRLERLAGDSVAELQQESGLTTKIVENYRKKGTSLREQFEFQVKLLANLQDQGKLNLDSEDIKAKLFQAQEQQQNKLLSVRKQLTILEAEGNPRNRELVRSLREEVRYREQALEYLNKYNITAVQGLEEILARRKELLLEQRKGSSVIRVAGKDTDNINAFSTHRVDFASKLLNKVGVGDAATKLNEEYNQWITRRVAAIEDLEAAESRLKEVEKERIARERDLNFEVAQSTLKLRDRIAEEGSGSVLIQGKIGQFNALTNELQDQVLKYRDLKQELRSLGKEREQLDKNRKFLKRNLSNLVEGSEEYENVKSRLTEINKSLEENQTRLDEARKKFGGLAEDLQEIGGDKLKSRFKDFTFVGTENLQQIADAQEKLDKLRNLAKEFTEKRQGVLELKNYLGEDNIQAALQVKQNVAGQDYGVGGRYVSSEIGNLARSPEFAEYLEKAKALETITNNLKVVMQDLGLETKNLEAKGLSEDLKKSLELSKEELHIAEQRRLEQEALNVEKATAAEQVANAERAKMAVFGDQFKIVEVLSKVLEGTLGTAALLGTILSAIFVNFTQVSAESANVKRLIGEWTMGLAGAHTGIASIRETTKLIGDLTKEISLNPISIFTDEELGRMADAQKLMGFTSTQAAGLGVQSKLNAQSSDEYRKALTRGINAGQTLHKTIVAHGVATREALEASDAIKISMGNNAEAIGKAVVAAKSLGMNLKDVESVSRNLIEFQSSIESEMQAQLLTGHQLNLARARELALNNDLEGVVREIGNQGITMSEYGHMNLIQQENIAKALGMSRDQMAKMLVTQALSEGLTAKQIADAGLMNEKQIEAMSLQESWKAAMERLMGVFLPIFQLLLPFAELVARIISPIAGLVNWLLEPLDKFATWLSKVFAYISEGAAWLRKTLGIESEISDTAKTVIGAVEAIAVVTGIVLFNSARIAGHFGGILKTAKGVGKIVGDWGKHLFGANTEAIKFGEKVGRWRDVKTGKFAKDPDIAKKAVVSEKKAFKSSKATEAAGSAAQKARTKGSNLPKLGSNIAQFLQAFVPVTEETIKKTRKAALSFIPIALASPAVRIADNVGAGLKEGLLKLGSGIVSFYNSFTAMVGPVGKAIGASLAFIPIALASPAIWLASKLGDGVSVEGLVKLGSGITGFFNSLKLAKIAKGVLAMTLIAVPIAAFGLAVKTLEGISLQSILIGIGAMVAMAGAVALLGAVFTGPQALWALVGLAMMAGMSGVIFLLGKALKSFEGVDSEKFKNLPEIMWNLASTGIAAMVAGPTLMVGAINLIPGAYALAQAFKVLATVGDVNTANILQTIKDLKNIEIPEVLNFQRLQKIAQVLVRTSRRLRNVSFKPLENLSNLGTGLSSTANVLVRVGEAIGLIATNLNQLDSKKLSSLRSSRLSGNLARLRSRLQEKVENLKETTGSQKETIAAANQEVTVKRANQNTTTQQISIEQRATDLKVIERKLDNVIAAIGNSRPDWDWVKFEQL